jgi:hypothetical protein
MGKMGKVIRQVSTLTIRDPRSAIRDPPSAIRYPLSAIHSHRPSIDM